MLSELQKQTIQAMINIFETGRALGDYGQVTLLAGDAGHLTYGRSQTTLASGNLSRLIKSYCAKPGAADAAAFKSYLGRLDKADLTLDRDMDFRALLKKAGSDPVMQDAQDSFFDQSYWMPAAKTASDLGFSQPLCHAVVYDSFIHGSWNALCSQTKSRHGEPNAIGEKKWITSYVLERRDWLARNTNPLLRKTIYRMDSFNALIKVGNWGLALPLSANGVKIDASAFGSRAKIQKPEAPAQIRILRLTNPPMKGADVRDLQEALTKEGYAVNRDGVFDQGLESAFKAFQEENGIVSDGVVGTASRAILGLDRHDA